MKNPRLGSVMVHDLCNGIWGELTVCFVSSLRLSWLSQACVVGPCRERVQMEHCLSPGVDGQCDAEDPYNVHHYAGLCLE